MSIHNHDEVLIKQTVIGKRLQKKADALKDEKIINALKNANVSGLSKGEAKAKLDNIVDEILEE